MPKPETGELAGPLTAADDPGQFTFQNVPGPNLWVPVRNLNSAGKSRGRFQAETAA